MPYSVSGGKPCAARFGANAAYIRCSLIRSTGPSMSRTWNGLPSLSSCSIGRCSSAFKLPLTGIPERARKFPSSLALGSLRPCGWNLVCDVDTPQRAPNQRPRTRHDIVNGIATATGSDHAAIAVPVCYLAHQASEVFIDSGCTFEMRQRIQRMAVTPVLQHDHIRLERIRERGNTSSPSRSPSDRISDTVSSSRRGSSGCSSEKRYDASASYHTNAVLMAPAWLAVRLFDYRTLVRCRSTPCP
jgi:hypothetical protein